MSVIKQRTIDNMNPIAKGRAKNIWEQMYSFPEGSSSFNRARGRYHAMFRNDANFLAGTETYRSY